MAKTANNKGGKTVKKVTRKVQNKAQNSVEGFVEFIRTQGVVGLAIGFIMGVQAKTLIDQMTKSIVEPLLILLFGGAKPLSDKTLYIQINSRGAEFAWGALAYAIINFLIIAGVVYYTFKWLRLDKLDKKNKK